MNSYWKDCKAWETEGLKLQTTNNQTAKLFDVNLTQFISLQELPSFGGIEKSMADMLESDPDFVLGRVFKHAMCFVGNSFSYDGMPAFRADVDLTLHLAKQLQAHLTEREKLHVEALKHMKEGWKIRACDTYEQILQLHPCDFMAHKLNQSCLLFLGEKVRMKTSVEVVFKGCPRSNPLQHFLYGDMSFSYCENGLYLEGEELGRKGLSMYQKDAWSTHAVAHCLEMTGRFEEGGRLLDNTVQDWEACSMFASHIHWHNALFKMQAGEYDAAVDILCREILKKRLKEKSSLTFVDATSLLYRLKLQGVVVTEDLSHFSSVLKSHLKDHTLPFNDLHLLLGLLSTQQLEQAENFLHQLEEYVSTTGKPDSYKKVTNKVGISVAKGLLKYEKGDYAGSVRVLQPAMEDLLEIGGSDAQRDVFKQVLWNAASRSDSPEHHFLASNLIKKVTQLRVPI